ncbi:MULTISPECIES: Fe2+-dependent dioxygenase [unclassified Acinetobacter]|uniref:Fe2+-dependent dioxygenase n=1 Tax=unclassified Acinetobacter TaxID=196816 RepID=UPI0029350D67|nr:MULTISPECIES: Fe2+-dependent dioxygenase [unclassified Acinetobacter]WOE30513.1 Fe2+-dependent dioxygenase [Acinetobacter sp. SAAs470]WOE38704.1 Fe2+-dependent dioxygenase [Acinetobacter sp. SAAs474]
MIHHIPNILSKEQVAYFREEMAKIDWIDGKQTTGSLSANVKQNRQLPANHPLSQHLGQIVLAAVKQNSLFMSAALPLEILAPYFNRYESGETFGFHIDNAIRWPQDAQRPIRTDLSCTLFLTEPEDYDGGELVIEDTYGYHEVKLPAGDLILYPSTSIHEVSPVTSGCRIGSFFWLQSMIRDDADRYTLFNLDQSIQKLRLELGDQHAEVVQLSSLYHNLIRKWAEL